MYLYAVGEDSLSSLVDSSGHSGTMTGSLTSRATADSNTAFRGIGFAKLTSTTALTASPNPAIYGDSVTFTATVSPSAASGTVTFKDGAKTLGAGTLSNGVATFATNNFGAGSHTITAEYAGDGLYLYSTNSLTLTVNQVMPVVTTWPTSSVIYLGQTLASSTLSGGVATPVGSFGWTTPSTAPNAGTSAQSVTYTPTDTAKYASTNYTVNVTVDTYTLGATYLVEGCTAGTNSALLTGSATNRAAWTASASVSWLHPATSSGSGIATIVFSFDANTGSTRTGTVTIAGQPLTVRQAGAAYLPANPVALGITGLSSPRGVAVDASGNVYIADTANSAIKKWNPSNNTTTTLVATGLNAPRSVAVDDSGRIYIADTGNSAIKRYNPADSTVTTLVATGLSAPRGVTLGGGNLYITDSGNNALKCWNLTNSTLTTVISTGLNSPGGVAVDLFGNVYVADTGNGVIKKWAVADGSVSTLAASGLSSPEGLAVDASGNLYVADSGNNAIKRWNLASGAAAVLSASGFNSPGGLAVDVAGSLFIADTGNNALKSLPRAFVVTTDRVEGTAAGTDNLPVVVPTTQSLSGPFTPTSDQSWLTIVGATDGVVGFTFTANTGPARSANITLLGRTIALTQAGLWAVGTPNLLECPAGGSDSVTLAAPSTDSWTCTANSSWLHIVTTSGTGSTNVVFTFDDNTVSGLTRTGSLTVAGMTVAVTQAGSAYAPANQMMTLLSSNIGSQGTLALDAHDNVYVADTYGWTLLKWDATSNALSTVLSQTSIYYRCLAVDGAGNVFFYAYGEGQVKKWDAATGDIATLATYKPGLGGVIFGMAVDRFGNLYIAFDDDTVKKWDATTGTLTTLVTGVTDPYDVVVDVAGNVYIADVLTPAVWKWTLADASLTKLPISGLGRPECLAVDGSGNVFLVDYPYIKKWSAASNTVSTVCSTGNTRKLGLDSLGNLYAYNLTATQSVVTVWPKAYLDPAPRIEPAGGGNDPVVVLPVAAKLSGPFAPAGSDSWLQISSVSNGVVNLSVPPNPAASARWATLRLLSNNIPITQTATPPAAVALGVTHLVEGPASGTDSVVLSVIPASQTWVSSANASWLHLVTASGAGSTNVVFTFDANPGATRTGTLTVAGLTLSVTQAGAAYISANPMAQLLPPTNGIAYILAVDSEDNLLFTHYEEVRAWNPASGLVSTLFTHPSYGISVMTTDWRDNVHSYWNTFPYEPIRVCPPGGNSYTLVATNLNFYAYDGLAVDRSGNVYTANSTEGLREWVAASNSVTTLTTNVGNYAGMAADIAGNIYLGQADTNKIRVWQAADGTVNTLGPWSITDIDNMAVDGSGNVYGANSTGVAVWNPISNSDTLLASGFHLVFDIAVDSSRNVFVSDYTSGVGRTVTARLRAFVDPTPQLVSSAAASHSLPSVLPTTEPLCAPFAPSSDQSWLTITTATNGVVSYTCATNSTGANRLAHITLLGQSITVTQSVNVIKTTPTITAWPTASAITYGQTLVSSTLTGGTASVAGAFAWTASSTRPSAGTAPQSVTFTPTDTLNYNTVVGSSSVTVATKSLGVTGLVAADKFYDGTITASLSGTPALVAGDIVSGDDVSLASGGTPVGAFADREVGSGKAVSYASGLTLQGTAAGNYHLTGSATPAAILNTKTDTDTTTITVANSQSFDLVLNAGKLLANNTPADGSINGSGTIQVNSGATLGGNGKVGQVSVNSGGTIAPGTSAGTLNTESQTWAPGGTYAWELADATTGGPGVGWDWLNITGDLTITATNQPPNDPTRQFTLAISGAGLHFDNAASNSWVIATASGAVNGFNASKFILTTSGFTPSLNGGAFSVVLQDKSVVLVFTPATPPCAATTAASFAVVVPTPGTTNMQMTFTNASGLSSVQALTMDNCAITGTAYDSGDSDLGPVGPLSLTARTVLSNNTVKVVLTATKLTSGVPAEVNVLALDTCGRGKSFDPVVTMLEVTANGRVQQRFEGLLSAERYLHFINGTPGLARLEVVLNGHKFSLNSLTNGQTVNADLGAAMNEGKANVVVLTGYGEPGASGLVLITDLAAGDLVQLSEIVELAVTRIVELAVTRSSGQVMVAWTAALAGWQLQASDSLASGWQEVGITPVLADGHLVVTLPPSEAARFFRLSGALKQARPAALAGTRVTGTVSSAAASPPATMTYEGIAW